MTADKKYYAHSVEGQPPEDWQELEAHLKNTAALAAKMAGEFGCSEWGYLAGLWHDLGKYSPAFQNYIKKSNDPEAHIEGTKTGHVDHSTAGAIWATQCLKQAGILFSYLIAGHHAGLTDYESDVAGNGSLSQRLMHYELLTAARQNIPTEILNQQLPVQKPKPGSSPAFWVRLLFSCLVDADFIDTENFIDPHKAASRGHYSELQNLLPAFMSYMDDKKAHSPDTKVNRIRTEVFDQCIEKSNNPPGIYTLTVPTGGGKTLSSMAFALNHAIKYNKRRIIYVIPYTSIIEQTADQFRDIFGEAVIEHQSNLDVSDERKDNTRSRLACENWDAPVIVTTSVQFFESLFASRTSRCRKLHNIINSVIILDEAQLLPAEYLNPILYILNELQKNYGVTLVISTATQPALGPHKSFDFDFKGLSDMVEMVDNPNYLYQQLKRVKIELPQNLSQPSTWDDLANELIEHPSVLCVVNRRDDCRELWSRMPEGTFHLSALMCGAHRSARINKIKERIKNQMPTRVISTQLVEAGVDLDFPVVYRAIAGLDSIAQAAGRCNREGLLDKGIVRIFVPPSEIPAGHLRQAAQIGQRLLSQDCPDHLAPDRFESFFKEFYWLQGKRLDKFEILTDLQMDSDFRCSYRTAADKFHIVDDSRQASVIVTYEHGAELIRKLERNKPDRLLLREAQRYIVNLPRYIHTQLLADNSIEEMYPGIFVQRQSSMYNEEIGLCPDRSGKYLAEELFY